MTSGSARFPWSGADGTAYEATSEHCLSGRYPLARFLYVYVNKPPGKTHGQTDRGVHSLRAVP
jgi:phosphate transport system substrate-binding protein